MCDSVVNIVRSECSKADAEEDCCWLCLGGSEEGELLAPCSCPNRRAHRACLARWQLQCAGKR
jgi:hypothetical protein